MTQAEIVNKLMELKAVSYETGWEAKDLVHALKGKSRTTLYRNLRDCVKKKRIGASGYPTRYYTVPEEHQ